MTALPVPRPEDVYDAETVAGFRAAGYWRDETLSASVDRLAGQDQVLLTDGYGALTGTQLRKQAYRLAAALRWLGVEAGDRVQVQLPNWNEFVVVYVALARIGAVLVPTMPIYRLPEMLQVVDALPTTMTGKVQKFLLREAAQALAHQM
jgi:cyclohexanecarboxylate-CoA ligase/acyl-CoA synthetase